MTASILPLPPKYGPHRKPDRRRTRHKPSCPIVPLHSSKRDAYSLYIRASHLDEDHTTLARAIALYERAIAIDPDLALAHTNLGNCHYRANDHFKADYCYRRALLIDPNQPEALYNLGYLHSLEDRHQSAIDLYQRALANDSKFADAHFNLALAYVNLPLQSDLTRHRARVHFGRYLMLEQNRGKDRSIGVWIDMAKGYIDRLNQAKEPKMLPNVDLATGELSGAV